MSTFKSIDPDQQTAQDNYKLIIGGIVPRPIAFVSTCSLEGHLNLAPFSFFNGVCSNPPTIMFSTMRRGSDGGKKDTLINIEATGEFVVNVVTEEIVEAMNQTAGEYPPEVSEFELAGFTTQASEVIRPPRVQESPFQMECQLNQIVTIGDGSVGSGHLVIGTVVRFHVREDIYEKGRIITDRLKPVARLAGASYCPVRDIFDLARPAGGSGG
ncbi:MAG: flavin reductase family protein [Candidatus Melainabacteria bacterium]|nr:flavin reductase family protein [Candidatus Melainabacteria bacterium]